MQGSFVSWSGGKDGCLSCYREISNGLKIKYLVNMVTEDSRHSRTHGIFSDVLQLQSQAIGIPLIQRPTTWDNYETEYKKLLRNLKEEGVETGVFGDMDVEEHRKWVQRVCLETGITPCLPLWGRSQKEILKEFIDLGFEAVVVAAKTAFFGEEILGQKIDSSFIKYVEEQTERTGLTFCGEAGEYHTLVINGPMFKQRLEITESRKVLRDGLCLLEVSNIELKTK